jgi:hypothetical protein
MPPEAKPERMPLKLKGKISWLMGRVQKSLFPYLNGSFCIMAGNFFWVDKFPEKK